MTQGRIMAIDHGMVRIGIALSDPLRLFAAPYKILTQKSRTKTIAIIRQVVDEQDIKKIVVGLPTGGDGFLTQQALVVIQWAEALADAISIPIVFWDESHSSMEADSLHGTTSHRSGKSNDHVAAAIFLQEYLSALQENDEPGQTLEAVRKNQ